MSEKPTGCCKLRSCPCGLYIGPRTPEIEAVLMHGRDYLALMTPENRALLVEALDNLEAVTR